MNTTRVGLGCLGAVLGAGIGFFAGALARYPLAGLVTQSREAQEYLTILIVPAVVALGAATLAATLAALPGKRWAVLGVAGVGWLVLGLVVVLGVSWHHRSRPAQVRVRNDTSMPFRNLFLGGDFRRSTRIGELGPGETSRPVDVDLDQPGTFDALEGQAGSDYVRHHLSREEAAAVPDGDHVWIVGGVDGALTYELRREP